MALKSETITDKITDKSSDETSTNVSTETTPPVVTPEVTPEVKTPEIPFWINNPNVLFDGNFILEFFPIETMTYEQKLNAVSRTVVLLSVFGFLISRNIRTILVGIITLFAVFLMYYYHKKESFKNQDRENFKNQANETLRDNGLPINKAGVFMNPTSNNPFSNVLLTDYDYNPNKKPAPPAFNDKINEEIKTETKRMINEINSDQPDITKKLYKDLGEELEFEQSLRQFVSNPSTTIPNDQTSFAEFCYGSMVSCKEGNLFACARNKSNYSIY